jgi:hypothetical protein
MAATLEKGLAPAPAPTLATVGKSEENYNIRARAAE